MAAHPDERFLLGVAESVPLWSDPNAASPDFRVFLMSRGPGQATNSGYLLQLGLWLIACLLGSVNGQRRSRSRFTLRVASLLRLTRCVAGGLNWGAGSGGISTPLERSERRVSRLSLWLLLDEKGAFFGRRRSWLWLLSRSNKRIFLPLIPWARCLSRRLSYQLCAVSCSERRFGPA